MNVIKRLESIVDLTTNEKVVSEFIINNPDEFISLRPKEIAEATFVSLPTVYRLARKLGFAGINELKIEIASTLNEREEEIQTNLNYPIHEHDTHVEVMKRLKSVYVKTLDETLNLSGAELLLKATQMMSKASYIDVYTSAANIFFAENFQFQMQEIGMNVTVPKEDYVQRLTAANSDPSHLAIVISYEGRGNGIAEVLRILKENRVPVLLITSTRSKELREQATEVIYMASLESHYNKISSFSTRLTLLYILDTLYSLYFKRNYNQNLNTKLVRYKKINS